MNKVQKILSEIATRKLCTMDEHMAFYNDKAKEDYRFLSEIEEIIKGMQEEPISEELEEEASRYAKEEYSHKSPATLPDRCIGCYAPLMYAFKAGANWQKEQFEKDYTDLCKGIVTAKGLAVKMAYDKGMADARKQMIANAIDAEVLENYDGKGIEYDETILDKKLSDCKVFDKVKVIVIKEE